MYGLILSRRLKGLSKSNPRYSLTGRKPPALNQPRFRDTTKMSDLDSKPPERLAEGYPFNKINMCHCRNGLVITAFVVRVKILP